VRRPNEEEQHICESQLQKVADVLAIKSQGSSTPNSPEKSHVHVDTVLRRSDYISKESTHALEDAKKAASNNHSLLEQLLAFEKEVSVMFTEQESKFSVLHENLASMNTCLTSLDDKKAALESKLADLSAALNESGESPPPMTG
jgi:septal ring factor EnvC (AmiA/AmiB activator)